MKSMPVFSLLKIQTPFLIFEIPGSPFPDLPMLHITDSGIQKLLQGLNVHKAMGTDELSIRVLQKLTDEITPVLTKVFQKPIQHGLIPEKWRSANITPIFKKGNTSLASNDRPVSLTCVCSKMLEYIIVKHIMDQLEYHNILTDCQHGFRSRRLCETQTLTFVHELARDMQDGGQMDIALIMLMDFAKAFDKVPRKRLLIKLSHYGIRGPLLSWIETFLTHRTCNK